MNALTELSPEVVDQDGDGQLNDPVFFSLAAGSPSLAIFGRSAADILWTIGFQPGVYASAADLGLLTAGGVNVPIHAPLTAKQTAYQIADSGASIVLVSTAEQLAKVVDATRNGSTVRHVIVFDDIRWSGGMRRAWRRIAADRRTTTAADAGRVGIAVASAG